MARRKQTRGDCALCGRKLSGAGMSRHLAACQERAKAIAAADQGQGPNQSIYRLAVKDDWNSDYWLYLEMNGKARLEDLDDYLRAIWLECCGHMSHFEPGTSPWSGKKLSMGATAARVFEPGAEFTHLYDYGTTSYTRVRVLDKRLGKPLTPYPIALLARNDPPALTCQECDEPATWYCGECRIEEDKEGLLCDAHAQGHPHDEYGGPAEVYNSPRMGRCG